jgi:hypothetical protein
VLLAAALAAVVVYAGGPSGLPSLPPPAKAALPPPAPQRSAPPPRQYQPPTAGTLVAAAPPADLPPAAPPAAVPPVRAAEAAPESPAATPAPAAAPRPGITLHHWTEDELLASLNAQAAAVDLEATPGTGAKLLKMARETNPRDPKFATRAAREVALQDEFNPLLSLAPKRPDLAGLPLATNCYSVDDATAQDEVSKILRKAVGQPGRDAPRGLDPAGRGPEASVRTRSVLEALDGQDGWAKDDSHVLTLVQMLQVEEKPVRLRLVKLLAQIKGEQAGAALARRALFDLAPEVRAAAIEALKGRPPEEFRAALLGGFRHPWAPAAEHAAEALVALDDRTALPEVLRLLAGPDPTAPVRGGDGKWSVAELVRVNHLGNCLLCHAPLTSDVPCGIARAPVPKRGEPPPPLDYDNPKGDFVRADVTYLRQDFSVMQPATNHGQWPAVQRFDYLVRARELTPREASDRLQKAVDGSRVVSPQRQALLFAKQKLAAAGEDDPDEAWRKRPGAADKAAGP